MVKVGTLLSTLLAACLGVSSHKDWRSRTLELAGETGLDLTTAFPERWYGSQRVDHFIGADTRVFRQRYFENWKHFKPGGPVLLDIGGEGPLGAESVSGSYFVDSWLAQKLGAGIVSLEHRFYGKSQPFNSLATEHLRYLTSRQALADLARFQRWFTANRSLETSVWFCIGGSYPGNLAAWYRLEFPELTAGCWSASAPLQAVEDFPSYGQMVWRALSRDFLGNVDETPTIKLYAGFQMLADLIQDPDPASVPELHRRLNVCPGSLVSKSDRDRWESTLGTAVADIVQQNNSLLSNSLHLGQVRQASVEAATPLEAAFAVLELMNTTKGTDTKSCVDNSIDEYYRQLGNTTLPANGQGNADRTWFWQTCNEFGYFQTATAQLGVANFYTRGVSSRALYQQVCRDVFDIADTGSRIAQTNAYYGGALLISEKAKRLTHVLFTNGQLDPWSLLGMKDTSIFDANRSLHCAVAPLGSHCAGLYSPSPLENPSVKPLRELALQLFQQWMNNGAGKQPEFVTIFE